MILHRLAIDDRAVRSFGVEKFFFGPVEGKRVHDAIGSDERVAHFASREDFEVARAAAAHLNGLLRELRQRDIHRFHADGAERERHGDDQRDRAFARTANGAPPKRVLAPRVTLARADVAEVARRRPGVISSAAFRFHLSPPKGKRRTTFAAAGIKSFVHGEIDFRVMAFDSIDRRRFLLLAAAPLLAAQKAAVPRPESMLQMNGYAVNAETPLALLTDYVTPNELFFVRSHWIPRTPDPKKWRLTIDGEVERRAQLTLSDLKKLPRAEATCVLQCAGNGRGLYAPTVPGVQWRYGAAGNARWSGVRVRDVLERAGVKAAAKHLHVFGSDDP